MKSLRAWLVRLPRGLHFAVLGSLIFLARPLLPGGGEARPPMVIDAARLELLAGELARTLGRRPTRPELEAQVRLEVDDRLLELEARRLRLDFGDRSIEQRLILKMRAIASDLGASDSELYEQALELGLDDDVVIARQLREKMRLFLQQDPAAAPFSQAELAAARERYRQRFVQPATYTFTQLLASLDLHGERTEAHARALHAAITRDARTPEEALPLGDPFPLAAHAAGQSREQVAKIFGPAFADALSRLEPGTWSAPIASPFGWHLVFLHEKTPGGLPPIESLRPQLLPLLEEERAARRLEQALERLRELYEVEVEWPAAAP